MCCVMVDVLMCGKLAVKDFLSNPAIVIMNKRGMIPKYSRNHFTVFQSQQYDKLFKIEVSLMWG